MKLLKHSSNEARGMSAEVVENTMVLQEKSENGRKTKGSRLISLDALRGLSIVIMLLVNNFGPARLTPLQFQHAAWGEGIHLADLAFPWFLLCAGIAIPFSVASSKKKSVPWWKYELKVFRRILILLALGALLDCVGDKRLELFSIGVLQTIALAYAVGALLYDLAIHRRLLLAFFMLAAYWAAIKFIVVPGVGAGVFEESRNLILHLNSTYLGQAGLWNVTRLIPTSALVLIGTAIGDVMQQRGDGDRMRTLRWLAGAGAVLVIAGYLWSFSLPFNKPIWTPSYILLSAGTGTLVLAAFYAVIDIRGWKRWAMPLVVFGSNAILAYVAPILFKELVLVNLDIYVMGWLGVIPFTLFWWLVMWILYKKKLFLRA